MVRSKRTPGPVVDDARSYHVNLLRLTGEERFFVWCSDTQDGVLLSAPGTMAFFTHLSEVERYASAHDFVLEASKPHLYDLDRLTEWLSSQTQPIDCEFLLDTWNLLTDIAATLQTRLIEPTGSLAVYDKLFWGCNLPSMTPPGRHYEPIWSPEEVGTLVTVLRSGLQVLHDASP